MNSPFSKVVCWHQDRIGEVINKEALSVDRAEFLATHVPIHQIVVERSPRTLTHTSEEGLLEELHTQAETDQHAFVVIKGAPGTGKSHLIRWLKERYAAERPHDAVLLIERANTSLRGTLQQIIQSGIFDQAGLPESLQRLQDAVTELSADALADNILDQVKTATLEVEVPEVVFPRRLHPERIHAFLLDLVVRDHLKAPNGPIQRTADFLSQGREDSTGTDEIPGFEAEDFNFKPETLRRMRGYDEARRVAEDLHTKVELRELLARYLNILLHKYAISRATRLSAQDLRQMFYELRQHLRTQGMSLALFVEDITAFTGIDEGLLDVLITQHRGEAGQALCRLTSAIGVTDAYYSDYMPDNVKQRATHQLNLNSSTVRGASELMQEARVRAEFAARYMNAMRLSHERLELWVRSGASLESMPNACDECRFRDPCHEAFGAFELGDEEEKRRIGLYPYNQRALDGLYRALKEGYSRTPRTYLFDLLGYTLQSHTERIPSGDFPPPENEMTPAVQPPIFNPAAHRQTIERQGGTAASRLMSLLLFWGDRSAVRTELTLGGLPEGVFRAFGMKMIEGVARDDAPALILEPQVREITSEAPRGVSEESERYTRLIDTWMTTGRLSSYDRFAEWMAEAIRSFIDWQAYGISLAQVREYITQGRLEIEGQTGTPQRKHRLVFTRTPELRYVLQALADLRTARQGLSPAQYGEHLATLSMWLRAEEARIVAFVREPSGTNPLPNYLVNILARNVVVLACLGGELNLADDVIDMYRRVVASAAANTSWEKLSAELKDQPVPELRALIRRVNGGDAVAACRAGLLQLLNRPQGTSETVRYVDAAQLLGIIEAFNYDDWQLPELELIPDTNDTMWAAALTVYQALYQELAGVVEACFAKLRELHGQVVEALGGVSPMDALTSVQAALDGLRPVGILYSTQLDQPFARDTSQQGWNAERIRQLLESCQATLQEKSFMARVMYIGNTWASDITWLQQYADYFRLFEHEMEKKGSILAQKIAELRAQAEADDTYKQSLGLFDQLTSLIDETLRDNHD